MKIFVESLKYVPSGMGKSTHNLEIGAWGGKEKENTWEIELFVKMRTGILLCFWRFTKLRRLQFVILKSGGSSELLWRPGQRERTAGWPICSCTVGCGKSDELSVGQTDVMKSSSFKGKPLYCRVAESMDLRIWTWWNMPVVPSGGSICRNPVRSIFPRCVQLTWWLWRDLQITQNYKPQENLYKYWGHQKIRVQTIEYKSYKVFLLSSSPHPLPPPLKSQQHKGVRVSKEPEEKNWLWLLS